MPNPSALFLGDSLTTGYGLTNPATERWPARLCAAMGWTEDNQAVSAKQAAEEGQTDELLGHTVTSDSITCVLSGINDMRANGLDADWLDAYRDALAWVLATAAVPTDDWVEHDEYTTTSGVWQTNSLLNGLAYTSETDAYREYSVTGSSILFVGGRGVSAGDYTIDIDGQQVHSGTAEMPAATVAGRTYQGAARVFTGLSDATHTVRVTGAGGVAYVGRMVGLPATPAGDQPLVLCGGVTAATKAYYALHAPFDQGSEQARKAYSDVIRELCDEFRAAGLDVRRVDAAIDPATQTTDDIHFDSAGAQRVANQFEEVALYAGAYDGRIRATAGAVFAAGCAMADTQPAGEVIQ